MQPIHILSLGAGVQSSTMALKAAVGDLSPMPLCALFADTHAEPRAVYDWLDWLEKQLPFPVIRLSKGGLTAESLRIRTSKKTAQTYLSHTIPAFTVNPSGTHGMVRRQCTDKHKLSPLRSKALALSREHGNAPVQMWIGISTDEAHRMKPSLHSRITHCWPLIDMEMSRRDCLMWMAAKGYPIPPRSACVYCPYHSDDEWIRLRAADPAAFAEAVDYEQQLQAAFALVPRLTGIPFLHASRKPLAQVEFKPGDNKLQFGNECTGMCGV
jgi:hypothetical protein